MDRGVWVDRIRLGARISIALIASVLILPFDSADNTLVFGNSSGLALLFNSFVSTFVFLYVIVFESQYLDSHASYRDIFNTFFVALPVSVTIAVQHAYGRRVGIFVFLAFVLTFTCSIHRTPLMFSQTYIGMGGLAYFVWCFVGAWLMAINLILSKSFRDPDEPRNA